MAAAVITSISIGLHNTVIWVLLGNDGYETFLTCEEYFGWVNNAESILETFLNGCFLEMDEATRAVRIIEFIRILKIL